MNLDGLKLSEALQTAFKQIRSVAKDGDIEEFKAVEEDRLFTYHHGLGRYLRNSLGLWDPKDPNNIKKFFREELHISHPDDISSIILTSFHRYLHGKPLNLQSQAQHYLDYWASKKCNPDGFDIGEK